MTRYTMELSIMGWLHKYHPDIHSALHSGMILAKDPECIEAMRSPRGLEQWLKRHHPTAYKEWEAARKRR